MSVYKDKSRNTWLVKFQYKNWMGDRKWVTKRGFSTKKEALQWEREFMMEQSSNPDTPFSVFAEVYKKDRLPRVRESTFEMKVSILDKHIVPYFGKKPLREIDTLDVMRWQNELLAYRDSAGKPYSKSYLKTIHNQLSAVFNHAVRFYKLKENPAAVVGNMGSDREIQMKFWTKEEYLKFSEYMMDDLRGYYCFQVLYWCGLREGEMLALTPADVDLENSTISVTKTYQRLKGRDVITDPKTPKSKRTVSMPVFLKEELAEYIQMHHEIASTDRLFPVSKSYLHHVMDSACANTGLTRIRIHDLRHSHVSLLINMGYSAVAIAERLGHESIDITYRYAHLFPSVQTDMADKLNALMEVEPHVS